MVVRSVLALLIVLLTTVVLIACLASLPDEVTETLPETSYYMDPGETVAINCTDTQVSVTGINATSFMLIAGDTVISSQPYGTDFYIPPSVYIPCDTNVSLVSRDGVSITFDSADAQFDFTTYPDHTFAVAAFVVIYILINLLSLIVLL